MAEVSSNEQLHASSFLQGHNAEYVEQLHARYIQDPNSVDPSWQSCFQSLGDVAEDVVSEAAGAPWGRPDWPPSPSDDLTHALDGNWSTEQVEAHLEKKIRSRANGSAANGAATNGAHAPQDEASIRAALLDSIRAIMYIRAFRSRGHLGADLDPLKLQGHQEHPEFDPRFFGFTDGDMDRPIFIDNVLGLETATMRQIQDLLKRTYQGTFALQFMHLQDPEPKSWLQQRIEGLGKEISFTDEGRKAILNKLIESEGFEKFLHVKYMGTKRFGLDGGEALIPAMEQIIKRGGALGAKDIIFGMPHRGRLNILANVMAKPYRAIFHEFQGGSFKPEDVDGSGDVKYHLGASSDRAFDGNTVHLSLTANPSHLEAVNPVVLGKARAKQAQLDDNRAAVIPVLLHGDAAFAGQGVVAECFGLSGLKGHKTGGTIHIVVNNQIGFTTAPHFSRSSPYPTDIAKIVDCPIFHVNGDDPEAVVHAAKVATEFRQKFQRDVVIDIFCYRRFGHNEGDEPMFTQPLMYKAIKKQQTTLEIYSDRLVADGLMKAEEIEAEKKAFQEHLAKEFDAGTDYRPNKADWLDGRWSGMETAEGEYQRGQTAVPADTLREVGKALTALPDDYKPHRTVSRMLEAKKKMLDDGAGIDWATAEALAFGSLMLEGYKVRLSGQDCTRGTFSQRHSGIVHQETEDRYYPLNHIREGQAQYEVIDSMLSEYAVLGYEYGFSLSEPNALVLWEAQFGDFANGAQIMIDQFISCGERKWLRMSGLVMLLPHGYEGQGPEHSSARIERFLQLSAEENWIVANCSTPANYFHILRRQMHRSYRKPLVLFTPKSLLRHKLCVSDIGHMAEGSSFHRVLWDDASFDSDSFNLKPDNEIKRVVICSGKVYFDLKEARDSAGRDDVYLLRIEQFYPFPALSLTRELARFSNAEMIWCQEEPKNQGPWSFVEPNIEWVLTRIGAKSSRPEYAGRPASASPATGLASKHKAEQQALIEAALGL
ncbi:MAG: 2-oxoglutarate dehydrogenase E1 component [Pseudomonadota bacterium]